jgi:hypothetical protein
MTGHILLTLLTVATMKGVLKRFRVLSDQSIVFSQT